MGNVEIKLNFGAAQIENAKTVFGLEGEPEQRKIWFGEVIDSLAGRDMLPLLERGVILRFRDKRKSDATLKLRALDGAIDAAAWKERTKDLGKAAKLEGDWAGNKRMISASLSGDLDAAAVDKLRSNHPSVAKLLSAEQQAVATELIVPFERAVLLGPVAALKWEAADGVEAEQWDAGGDLRFLEISIVEKDDPVGAMNRLVQRAKDGGLAIDDSNQEPKTTRVLKELARRR
jgi:hypothetical protein